jgi:hypothetical protein
MRALLPWPESDEALQQNKKCQDIRNTETPPRRLVGAIDVAS